MRFAPWFGRRLQMRRILWLVALALSLIPGVSQAIQLHWGTGADTLTFAEATRAILVVGADSAEVTLPPEWRLLWVGDSTEVEVVALDSLAVCAGDTAQVYGVDGPSTPEDSTAHRVTAHFCSGGSGAAEQATYVLDLPAWGRGKLKVVALDRADTTQVIESNEVTFNGGASAEYGPTILATPHTHDESQLRVHAVGTGLAGVANATLKAPDGTWSFPLSVTGRTDSSLTATGVTVAAVPECVLSAGLDDGGTVQAPVAAEASSLPLAPLYMAEMMDPDPDFYPKDFALVYTPGKLHCIYIRHNAWERVHGGNAIPDSLNERAFGHRWTSDWVTWEHDPSPADTTVLTTRDGWAWDNTHVWAPTVVQQGLEFYLFYTGVHYDPITGFRIQRMGLARSFDLTHWTRNGPPVDSVGAVPWADHSTQRELAFRDPFVMRDPTRPTGWLMYYVASMGNRIPQMAVGVARSNADTLGSGWTHFLLPLVISTDQTTYGVGKTESPHLFWDRGKWWMLFTTGSGRPISTATNAGMPVDTVAADSAHWSHMRLFFELEHAGVDSLTAASYNIWSATEYLPVGDLALGGREFLGAYDGTGIRIQEMHWLGTTPDYFSLSDPTADVSHGFVTPAFQRPALVHAGANPGRGGTQLRIELAPGEKAQLDVYDLAGRRVRVLLDGMVRMERTTVSWDGRDCDGRRVPAGVYFAKLSCPSGVRSLRVALLW
jgi:hypothetical protein